MRELPLTRVAISPDSQASGRVERSPPDRGKSPSRLTWESHCADRTQFAAVSINPFGDTHMRSTPMGSQHLSGSDPCHAELALEKAEENRENEKDASCTRQLGEFRRLVVAGSGTFKGPSTAPFAKAPSLLQNIPKEIYS